MLILNMEQGGEPSPLRQEQTSESKQADPVVTFYTVRVRVSINQLVARRVAPYNL